MPTERRSLRARVLEGGAVLALRQGLSIGIAFAGTALLVRMLGPTDYGAFAAAFALATWAQNVLSGGVTVHLVRREADEVALWWHAAVGSAVAGLLVAGLGAVLGPALGRLLGVEGFAAIAAAVFVTVPLWLVAQVAAARLERDLSFGTVALAELGAQLVFFAVALPAAWTGLGAWAPVLGLIVSQAARLAGLWVKAGLPSRGGWQPALARELAGAAAAVTASLQVWQLRHLVAPLIVGPLAGADAVAHVTLAHKLVESLGFVKNGTWRLALVALAKVGRERLREAVEDGMRLQVLAIGPLVVAFAWVAPTLVPAVFGAEWTPTATLFPWLAAAAIAHAAFAMHGSALLAVGDVRPVLATYAVNVALFAGLSLVLVPRVGLLGYAWAELAALSAYLLLHHGLARIAGAPDPRAAGPAWLGCTVALFPHALGWWAAAGIVPLLAWPTTWRTVGAVARAVRRTP